MLPLPPPPQPEKRKDTRALYTAFAEALGYHNPTKIERGRINAAIRDLPDDATPDQVRRRTAIFLKESGLTFVGPQGIVGNWSRLADLDKTTTRTPTPTPIEPAPAGSWTPMPDDVKAHITSIFGTRSVTSEAHGDDAP